MKYLQNCLCVAHMYTLLHILKCLRRYDTFSRCDVRCFPLYLFPEDSKTLIQLTHQCHCCRLVMLIIRLLPWVSGVKPLVLDHLLKAADALCGKLCASKRKYVLQLSNTAVLLMTKCAGKEALMACLYAQIKQTRK